MTVELPAHPNLTQLKKQARDLKRAAESGDDTALERIRAVDPSGKVSLRTAQLAIAREYGFAGWHALSVEVGRRMVEEGDLHRWFGVQLNNGSWEVIDSASVTPASPLAEREHVLYGAYASADHWQEVGTVANRVRGEHLIARTALLVGFDDTALRHARRCLDLIESNPGEVTDWDLGFALEALARAEEVNALPSATATRERAEGAAAAIEDPTDRHIVEQQLTSEGWPRF